MLRTFALTGTLRRVPELASKRDQAHNTRRLDGSNDLMLLLRPQARLHVVVSHMHACCNNRGRGSLTRLRGNSLPVSVRNRRSERTCCQDDSQ